jgi:ketosteroid isomerase-like protein
MNVDADAVRAANARFYQARSGQNLLEMEGIWSHAPHVCCVHPNADVLTGWDRIRDSWREILSGALCLTVEPEGEMVTVVGPAAIVTCRERITAFTLDGSMVAARLATNVFQKRRGRWQLIVHHASPLDTPRA